MSEGPWNDYQEDDGETAVADGPWSDYAEADQTAPTLPGFAMQEAANSIPLPGYTTPFGQDIERTARAMVQSQPSEQALEAGAFQNQRTLEPPPMPDGLAESGNMEGFGSMGNVDPALYRDTLRESVKQLTPSPKTVRSAREYTSLLGALAHPENPNSVDEALNRLAGPDLPPEDFDKAVAGGLGATYRQVESFLQPEQLPLVLAGSVPGKLGMAVTAAFYADMVRHSPEVFNKVVDALESGDPQREAEALTDAVVHGAFLGLTGKHTADSIRQGVDSFIQSNGPEARRRYYEQAEKSQQATDLAPLPQPEAFGVSTPEEAPSPTTSVEALAPRDEIPRAEGNLGRPVPKTEEEIQHALSVRSSETLSVGEAPQNSGEVGARVPTPEEPARTQGGTGDQSPPQPAETAPGEISLRPAIRANGEIVEGTLGKSHADLITDATKSGDPIKIMAAVAGSSEGRGFVDQDGKFYTRKEAEAIMREQHGDLDLMKPTEGLHSEDLNSEGKPKALKQPGAPERPRDDIYPLSEFKGELPASTPHFPVLIERADGSRYEAYLNGFYDMPGTPFDGVPSIGKVKPSGATRELSLSHGILDPAEKIVGGDYPKNAAEYKAAKESGVQPPRTLGETEAPSTDTVLKTLDNAIDRLGLDPSKSFADPFFVQSVGKPVARAALIAARAAYKTSKDVGQAITAGLRNLHAAGVRFNATLTQVHAQQWLHSMLTAPKPGGLGRVLGNLNRKRQAFGSLFRSEGNRKLMDQTFDAVENMANIAGQQARKTLDIGTKPIEREAALAVIEANGDITKLDTFEQQAKAGDHAGAEKAVNYARANWRALQPLADRMKRLMNDQVADEHANGITTEYHEAYVPHIYHKDLWMGAGRPFVVGTGGGGGAATGFKKGRSFPTIFDAIEAGYHPQTLDVGKLAEHRVKNGQKLINRKQWGEMLSTVHDPTDGKSIVTAMVRKSRGPGRPGYEVAPMGYVPREIIPGVRVAIHEGYAPLFDAMTATSRISGNAVGQMLLQTEGALKHGLLLFDTFHASRIIQKQLVLTGRLDAGARGHTLLEYSNTDLGRATAAGLITPEMANWVRTNRPTANLLIKSGLNVGRVSEALYTSFVREIPGLGTFNKWVFEKLTRGALLQAGLIEFDRVSQALPHLSPQQVALKVSRDLNAYFGNLGRQGLFKSGTGQDLARLVFLAPNWVESMARTEVGGAAQIARGLTHDPIIHRKLLTGTLGKGVAQGLLAYFIGTQLLNLVTRGQPTWKNPEDKHKLDAWIPDLSGKGGHGFFISPFSVVAELTHDMIRYAQSEGTALKAAAKIGGNKLSPPARALKILTTGRDFDKTHIDSTWGRVKAAGMALAPTPIPLAPVIKGTQYPGQTQRQLTASMGFKTEPAESATQQVSAKAQKFLAAQGKAHPFDFEPTEDPSYAKLRAIIRKGDNQEALGMLGELEKNHTGKQVLTAMRNHVRHPFTGSKSQERAFLGSLNDQEAGLYDKARDEQKAEYDTFLKLWYSRAGAPVATNAQPAAIAAPWLRY